MFLLLVIVDAQISPNSGLLCRRGEEAFFIDLLVMMIDFDVERLC